MITPLDRRLRLRPWRSESAGYTASKLRRDIQAGLTVAVFAIPQAMAYAMLAGLPPVFGLFSAIMLSIIAALLGSSTYANTGPTNSSALLTASVLAPFAATPHHLGALFVLTLLVGVIRLLLAVFRLGRLLKLVPESAFLGFTVGAGVLIAFGQLHHLFGQPKPPSAHIVLRARDIFFALPTTHLTSFFIGMGCLILMILFARYARRFPVALAIILLATGVSYSLGPASDVLCVKDISPVISAIPRWSLPDHIEWAWVKELFPAAFAIALIGLIEASSIAQRLALRHGTTVNFNQEFFGQGVSHIVGAFFQCFPGSGSFSRSAMIERSGGVTRFANVFFGLLTMLIAVLSPGLLNHIPIASLAGLLVYIGIHLVEPRQIRRVWATSAHDAIILTVTFGVTVFWRLEYGIFTGMIAAMGLFLNRASVLHLSELIPQADGHFDEAEYLPSSAHPPSDVVALTVSGDLFFGIADELRDQLNEVLAVQQPRFIVLRARDAYSIDYSCWNALFDFGEFFAQNGGKLYLCGVRPDFERIVGQAKMQHIFPNNQVYPQTPVIFCALHKALKDIASHGPDENRLTEEWRAYFRSPPQINGVQSCENSSAPVT